MVKVSINAFVPNSRQLTVSVSQVCMSVTAFYTEHSRPQLHTSEPAAPHIRCSLQYLNEGGANFVFRILPAGDGEDLPLRLTSKILRLRKDLPHVQSAEEQLAAFEKHFKHLFPPEHLVQHEIIELDGGVASVINAGLKDVERPTRRLEDFLPADERHAMLVSDLSPGPSHLLLQLKPKWLAQSPDAPQNAKRCRTCALRAQRASQSIRTATDAQGSCPLLLMSRIEQERTEAAQSITQNEHLQNYLIHSAQPLLAMLRLWQTTLDATGVLNVDDSASIRDLCKAMTLRDCTLFLKLSGSGIQACLADLDMKLPQKLDTWKSVEQGLLAEGWYTNTEDRLHWMDERVCLLSRFIDPGAFVFDPSISSKNPMSIYASVTPYRE